MGTLLESFLERLLATSVQTTVLAALVWLLVRAAPRLAPATQCWLWWLVALQALVGLVAHPIELAWLPQAGTPTAEVLPVAAVTPIAALAAPLQIDHGVPGWQMVVFVAWACGLAATAWLTLRQWRRSRELLRSALPCTDEALQGALARACAAQGIRRAPGMRQSDRIDSPLLAGHLRPVLLLPARVAMSPGELDMALAHELAHLRRGDLWWGCIPALARHIFFFHPFIHLAVREHALAREADCDAAVVASERFSRHDYGSLLLRLGTRPDAGSEIGVASPTFQALSRRLTMLQNTSFLPRAGALAILAAVAAGGVMPLRLVEAADAPAPAARPAPAAITAAADSTTQVATPVRGGIKSLDFRRSADGSGAGRLVVGLEDARTPVSVSRQDDRVVVEFAGAELPAQLHRHYDVSDFATPVTGINAVNTSSGAQLVATVTGEADYRSELTGNTYVVEFRGRGAVSPRAEQAPVHTGARMSASFEEIPTRVLLQLIAETSGRRVVVDDSVTGTITLSVENVPWDQLLDIVLRSKGLGMRMDGDTMFVAAKAVATTE